MHVRGGHIGLLGCSCFQRRLGCNSSCVAQGLLENFGAEDALNYAGRSDLQQFVTI